MQKVNKINCLPPHPFQLRGPKHKLRHLVTMLCQARFMTKVIGLNEVRY